MDEPEQHVEYTAQNYEWQDFWCAASHLRSIVENKVVWASLTVPQRQTIGAILYLCQIEADVQRRSS